MLKIDSNGVVWKYDSSSWVADPDYDGTEFASTVDQSYTAAIVFSELSAGGCLSSFDPGTNDRIFGVEEFCASTESKIHSTLTEGGIASVG